MRHRIAGRKLGRPSYHRWSLYRNQVTALLANARIVTTEAKAKEIKSLADKMITLGKDGSLASRRRALAFITDEEVVRKLFEEIAPGYSDRAGGYTRLVKLGHRRGDNAPIAQIELIK